MRIGLDVGGTKVDSCVLDEAYQIVQAQTFERSATYAGLLDQLRAIVDKLPDECATCDLGLGVPGLLDDNGRIVAINNVKYLRGQQIALDLANLIGRKVHIANHLQCYGLSEATSGFSLNGGLTVCLVIGTGVGAGLLFEGKPYLGANRMAGEFGSAKIIGNASLITHEEVISGAALARRLISSRGNDSREVDLGHYDISSDKLYMSDLADFILNIIYWLDPAHILLAGGIGLASGVAEGLRSTILERIPRDVIHTDIRRAFFGAMSGVRGAALLTTNTEMSTCIRQIGAVAVAEPGSSLK